MFFGLDNEEEEKWEEEMDWVGVGGGEYYDVFIRNRISYIWILRGREGGYK